MYYLSHSGIMIEAQIKTAVAAKVGGCALVAQPHVRGVTITGNDLQHHRGTTHLKFTLVLLFILREKTHQPIIVGLTLGMQVRKVSLVGPSGPSASVNMSSLILHTDSVASHPPQETAKMLPDLTPQICITQW